MTTGKQLIAQLDLIQQEWRAWRNFCHRFEAETGISVDDRAAHHTVKAIQCWGETLAAIRREQTDDEIATAVASNCDITFHPDTEAA